jgi:hypothetical protein
MTEVLDFSKNRYFWAFCNISGTAALIGLIFSPVTSTTLPPLLLRKNLKKTVKNLKKPLKI